MLAAAGHWFLKTLNKNSEIKMTKLLLPLAYLLTLTTLAIPVMLVEIPPLLDYPNHLARMHILAEGGENPNLNRHYIVSMGLQPNLGMDLIVPPLSRLVPLEVAGRLFIVLIFAVTLLGVGLVHRALFGQWSLWPLVSSLFLYNAPFLGGFMNFCLGTGLFLIGVGGWLFLRSGPFWLRSSVAVGTALILFFCHLLALVFYGVVVISCEFMLRKEKGSSWKNSALILGQFLLPIILFFYWAAEWGEMDHSSYAWFGKVRGPLIPLLNYSLFGDIALTSAIGVFLVWGIGRGFIFVNRSMIGACLLLVFLFILSPSSGLTGHWADSRFMVAAAFVLVAMTNIQVRSNHRAWGCVGILAMVLCIRIWIIADNWNQYEKDLQEYRQAIKQIESGSRLISAFPDRRSRDYWRSGPAWRFVFLNMPALTQLPCLAVIEKSVFYPLLFTHPRQHAVAVHPSLQSKDLAVSFPPAIDQLIDKDGFSGPDDTNPWEVNISLRDFDYLMLVYADYATHMDPVVEKQLEPVWLGSHVHLYRVKIGL